MNFEEQIKQRSGGQCELCGATHDLSIYTVPPSTTNTNDSCVYVCSTCLNQLTADEPVNPHHWRCLNDSMWSQEPAVQVVAWRMLNHLRLEGWPQDLLDMLYLDDDLLKLARSAGVAGAMGDAEGDAVIHRDCNGVQLQAGDTVTLVKDLDVKGSSLTAKRGTAVRNIGLVGDNEEHIEGRVNGQRIVILTKFVKKNS